MYLILTDAPPKEWQDIFNEERRVPRHLMWRDAWIDGNNIVICCVPEEIKMHLKDLRDDVSRSNFKYRGYLKELAQKETTAARAQARFTKLKDELKFD